MTNVTELVSKWVENNKETIDSVLNNKIPQVKRSQGISRVGNFPVISLFQIPQQLPEVKLRLLHYEEEIKLGPTEAMYFEAELLHRLNNTGLGGKFSVKQNNETVVYLTFSEGE